MYRQFLVHPEDRNMQCILWRDDPQQDITAYSLNTNTYGTSCAPYLAIRCIRQIAEEAKESYPSAASHIKNDFYVDDLITGFKSEEEAIHIIQQIKQLLQKRGLRLRKWISNSPIILKNLHDDNEQISILSLGDQEIAKTLGAQWMPNLDMLTYQVYPSSLSPPLTKRKLLSDISKLYDPLGLVSPCIIIAKIFIQQIWSSNLEWDEEIPGELQKQWLQFRSNLIQLSQQRIQRHVIIDQARDIEIHGFCDASQRAYGACLYIRSMNDQKIQVTLLCAKTRVAPLKVQTIPRLELCAAVMLSRLIKRIQNILTCHSKCFLWSDSTIVLSWIQTEPSHLQTFVANRVNEIQELTKEHSWGYVKTDHNPADAASRGITPEALQTSTLWWSGLPWLSDPQKERHCTAETIPFSELPETKKEKHLITMVAAQTEDCIIQRFSQITNLTRVTAFCLRFIHNTRFPNKRLTGNLSILEIENSLLHLVKISQQDTFTPEIAILKEKKYAKKHRLQALAPFLDKEEVLRVGGRLKHAQLEYNSKHPILLDGKHKLSRLIFEEEHRKHLHAAPQLLLTAVRQRYWVTNGMNLAKSIVRSCIRCFKFKPTSTSPIMAHLPENRVTFTSAFHVTGIDYGGPFTLKDRKGRGCKDLKGYICLFVCFASKAIHLEVVTDLTSDNFVSALRRFCARRGTPAHIYSDNATNFVGAQKELKLLHKITTQDPVQDYCTTQRITWHFIPPNSPHFGGIWESGIKQVKHHLLRVIGNTKLTYEEFLTVIVQIESLLNSRPLYPMSSDPNDLQPITPSHFLIGKSLITLPDPDIKHVKSTHLSRYHLLQKIKESFWERWSKDYLSSLQHRKKWQTPTPNLKTGAIVLIKQHHLPSYRWLLGRIIDVYPGEDGVIRVATVRTSTGIFKRSVAKLCPLPEPSEKC